MKYQYFGDQDLYMTELKGKNMEVIFEPLIKISDFKVLQNGQQVQLKLEPEMTSP
jgi:hypothetical protein